MTGGRLASLFIRVFFFFLVCGQFGLISPGFGSELPGAFSLALRRSSPTPLNMFVYWRRQQWTQKGEVRWRQGDEILSTFLC